MLVITLGTGAWEVRAVCDSSGDCLVLDVLTTGEETTNAHRRGMLNLLRVHIPQYGVPGPPIMGPLRDGLAELKKSPKGPKLRVVFFRDDQNPRVVVCTHAFWKDQRSMPEEIERAERLRTEYRSAQSRGTLVIQSLVRS